MTPPKGCAIVLVLGFAALTHLLSWGLGLGASQGAGMAEVTRWTVTLWALLVGLWNVLFMPYFRLWLAQTIFHTTVNYRYRPGGKWYASTRGIVHLTGDESFLRWKTCLATVINWAVSLPVIFFIVIWLSPKLGVLLADIF